MPSRTSLRIPLRTPLRTHPRGHHIQWRGIMAPRQNIRNGVCKDIRQGASSGARKYQYLYICIYIYIYIYKPPRFAIFDFLDFL